MIQVTSSSVAAKDTQPQPLQYVLKVFVIDTKNILLVRYFSKQWTKKEKEKFGVLILAAGKPF